MRSWHPRERDQQVSKRGRHFALPCRWQARHPAQHEGTCIKVLKPNQRLYVNTAERDGLFILYTKDVHMVMNGNDPSRSFRTRAKGFSSVPEYEENKQCWLLEIATDSDCKPSRSSTSSGCVFIGGNWVYSYSRTQRNITLSSADSEYIALVSGASEGVLLKAVLMHLVGPSVEMKLYADNIPQWQSYQRRVSKIKHLSGKLLWVQQRQGRDFQLRKIDTMTNPSDLGTKTFSGKRIKLPLYLIN